MIDQRGSLCNEARSNPVQRLNIELLLTLEVDDSHCWTRRGFRDALRIPVVVLLRFNIGANILGRHQSHFMSSSFEKSPQVVSAAACFHSNDACRHLAYKLNERLPPHRSADNHRTFVVNSHNAAAVLPYVDAKYRNRHDLAPIPSMTRHHTRCSRKGGPSHNQHASFRPRFTRQIQPVVATH